MTKKTMKLDEAAAEAKTRLDEASTSAVNMAADTAGDIAENQDNDAAPELGASSYFDDMAKSALDFELDTLAGDLRRDLLDRIKQARAPWPQLTSQEQSDIANGLDLYSRSVVKRVVYLLSREAFESTAVKLFDVQIKGSKGIVGKVSCDNVHENLRLMTENCDSLVKLVFVDSTVFMGQREGDKIDPDQPELPIDGVNDDQEKALAGAITAVITEKRASTSFIQRRLGIGYNKASSLIDRMEELGIVTAPDEVGARRILASDPQKALEAAGLVDATEDAEQEEGQPENLPKPSADLASADDLPEGVSPADVE